MPKFDALSYYRNVNSIESRKKKQEEPVIEEPKDEGSYVGDLGRAYGIGSNQLLKFGGDLYGQATGDTDNWASSQGGRGLEYYDRGKSEETKTQEKEIKSAVDATEGELAKMGISAFETLKRPRILSQKIVEQIPNLIAMGGAGAGAGAVAKAAGAGVKAATKVGTGGAVGAGGLMQGTDVASSTYDDIMSLDQDKWEKSSDYKNRIKTMSPEEAKHSIALERSRVAGVEGFATSLLTNLAMPWARVIEKRVAGGKPKMKGGAIKRTVKGAAGESLQEAAEEGSGQLFSNLGVQEVDPTRGTFEGVGEAAGQGAVVAGPMGGIAGLASEEDTPVGISGSKITDNAAPDTIESLNKEFQWSSNLSPIEVNNLGKFREIVNDPNATPEEKSQASASLNQMEGIATRREDLAWRKMAEQDQSVDIEKMTTDQEKIVLNNAEKILNDPEASNSAKATAINAQETIRENADKRQKLQEKDQKRLNKEQKKREAVAIKEQNKRNKAIENELTEQEKKDISAQLQRLSDPDITEGERASIGKFIEDKRIELEQRVADKEVKKAEKAEVNKKEELRKKLDDKKLSNEEYADVVDQLAEIRRNEPETSTEITPEEKPATDVVEEKPTEAKGIIDQAKRKKLVAEREEIKSGLIDGTVSSVEGVQKLGQLNKEIDAIPEPVAVEEKDYSLDITPEEIAKTEAEPKKLSQKIKAEYNKVINDSATVLSNPESTDAEKTAAQSAIDVAQKKLGTPEIGEVVSRGAMKNYAEAIRVAADIIDNPESTKEEVKQARTTLTEIKRKVNESQSVGKKELTAKTAEVKKAGKEVQPASDKEAIKKSTQKLTRKRLEEIKEKLTESLSILRSPDFSTMQKNRARKAVEKIQKLMGGSISTDFGEVESAVDIAIEEKKVNPTEEPTIEQHNDDNPQVDNEGKWNGEIAGEEGTVDVSASYDQKEAGNYLKAPITINGLLIKVETPAGTKRRNEWPELTDHYGDIKNTIGAEGEVGEGVDVFINKDSSKESLESGTVFVVDQMNKDGSFDEHKVILGAKSASHAKGIYKRNYSKGWTGGGKVTKYTWEEFKNWVDSAVNTSKPASESVVETAVEPGNLSEEYYNALVKNEAPANNNQLRKFITTIDGKAPSQQRMKEAQESIEVALVRRARDIVSEGGTQQEVFSKLVEMYNAQPLLNIRSSTSITNQAYSTPAPLAYLASEMAGIDTNSTVYEPTAGNGMLLVGANPDYVTANELNDDRVNNLRDLGFNPVKGDALTANEEGVVEPGSQDSVITNPPFGGLKGGGKKNGYKISKIDHMIAADALDAMADDGKATLIIAADKQEKNMSEADRTFFNWLYSNYNVDKHFEIDGKLYNRQGAGWPVRVISINGRQKSKTVSPDAETIERVKTWDEVYEKFENDDSNSNGRKPDAGLVSDRPGKLPASTTDETGTTGSGGGSGTVSGGGSNTGTKDNADGRKLAGTNNDERQDVDTTAKPGSGKATSGSKGDKPGTGTGTDTEQDTGKATVGSTNNTVVTDSAAEEALAYLKANLNNLNAGIDPKLMQAGLTLAVHTIEKGVKKYSAYVKEMVGMLGDAVRKYLRSWYEGVRHYPGIDSTEMSSTEEISSFEQSEMEADQTPLPEEKPEEGIEDSEKPDESVGSKFQTEYISQAGGKDPSVLVPLNMSDPIQKALKKIENEVGGIQSYLMNKLEYGSEKEMNNALMGLQRDSVAAAIWNIENEGAVIIADQTGIGKGRQAAAILRYARLQNKTPVFVTVKDTLYTDMFGDLADIGETETAPFIINNNVGLKNRATGETGLFKTAGVKRKRILESIEKTGKLPEENNMMFMTYSQINKENIQRDVIRSLSDNAIFVLDESHKAGGESSTGEFMKSVLSEAVGVTYLSATYAKRADNLPVYFRTDMSKAVDGIDELVDAIDAGGLQLQTIISNMLTENGQLFRRERSYEGINIPIINDVDNKVKHEKISDDVTSRIRPIIAADTSFHANVGEMNKKIKAEGKQIKGSGNKISEGVSHNKFTSVVHNVVRQMALAMKADATAEAAINALNRGEKPVIAVDSTMGSFLQDFKEDHGITDGQSLEGFDYRVVLTRALSRSRRIKVTDSQGNETHEEVPLSDLSPDTRLKYEKAQNFIDEMPVNDLPVSPIDHIINKIEKAGFTINEITGRKFRVDYSEETPTLKTMSKEDLDRVNTVDLFNNGGLDVVLLNSAGAEGISLHAKTGPQGYKDTRVRHMIVAQPALDVNVFMQILGRVHRTGQKQNPFYSILGMDIPAEIRPFAVLTRKLKSLNANTSSNTDSDTSVETVDMMNKYGDETVRNYLNDNPEVSLRLNPPDQDGDLALWVTGKTAILPIEQQKEFYADVTEAYIEYIEYLDKTGQNELEIKTLDLDAKLKSTNELTPTRDTTNIFGESSNLGSYDTKKQGKAPIYSEVTEAVSEELNGRTARQYGEEILSSLDDSYDNIINKKNDRINELQDDLDSAITDTEIRNINTSIESVQNSINAVHQQKATMESRLGNAVQMGGMSSLNIADSKITGVVTKIEYVNKTGKGSPYAPSKMLVTFYVNDVIRSVRIPMSRLFSESNPVYGEPKGYGTSIENEFSEENANNSRENRYIVTGNLLSAFTELQGHGQVVSFKDSEESTKQGILLPKNFNPEENLRKDQSLRFPEAAQEFLADNSTHPDIGRFGIAARDGTIRVKAHLGSGIEITVPKAKNKGGKWFLDPELTDITGDFYSARGSKMMSVTVTDTNKVQQALSHIMDKSGLYAPESYAEKAKSYADKHDPVKQESYSRGDTEKSGNTKEQVQTWLKSPLSKLGNWMNVRVVQSVSDIPGNHPSDVKGMAHEGIVYIVADNVTKNDVIKVLQHEAVGHIGLERLMGRKGFLGLVNQIQSMKRSGNKKITDIVEQLKKDYVDENGNYALDERQESREILAHLAEQKSNMMIVQRVRTFIRKWLIKVGLGNPDNAYIDDLILRATKLTQSDVTGFSEDIGEIKAYSRGAYQSIKVPAEVQDRIDKATPKIARWFKRNFTKEGLMNDVAFEAKLQSDAMKNVGEEEIGAIVHDLQKDVATAFGAKNYNVVSQANLEKINQYLAGEDVEIPVEARETLDNMRDYLDHLSGKMIEALDEGLQLKVEQLSDSARSSFDRAMRTNGKKGKIPEHIMPILELMNTINKNIGVYLNRSYQAFDDPTWMETVLANTDLMERAEDYIREKNPKLDDSEVTGAVKGILQDAKDSGDFVTLISKGTKVGSKDVSFLKKKKKLPEIMLELLGEYKDPRVNFTRSATKMQWYLANHHFLTDLRRKGLGVFLFDKRTSTDEGDFVSQITGKNTMNPLDGLFTTIDFKQGMEDVLDKFDGSDFMRKLIRMNSMVKYGKTILSPTTQMRNFWSAAMFTIMNGHFNWAKGSMAGKATWADLVSKDKEWRSYLNELISLGVIHNNPYAGELRDALKDMVDDDVFTDVASNNKIKKALKTMQKMYQAGDDFWKIIGYENELAIQIKNGESLEEAKKKAAYRIRNGYPTYSMVPRGIRKLRRWPLIGTFVSFPYEMMRTTWNQQKFIREDWNTNRQASVARMIGFGIASSAAYAASKVSMIMMGMDDDDDEAVRAQLPEWSRNSQLLYTGYDKNGLPTYWDMAHIDPYTYLKKPFTALVNGNNEGITDKTFDAMKEFAGPFIGTDIAAGTFLSIFTNKKDSGGRVYNPEDTKMNITNDIISYIRKGLQPGAFSNIERTLKAVSGSKATSGKEFTMKDEGLAWLGVRTGTLNLQQSMTYKAYGFSQSKRDASKILSKIAGSAGDVSESDLSNAFDSMISARNNAYKEMKKNVNGARKLGVSEKDIRSSLIGGGISKKDTSILMSDRSPYWTMSKRFIKSATYRAYTTTPNEQDRMDIRREMNQRKRFIRKLARNYRKAA